IDSMRRESMTAEGHPQTDRVAELRAAFDRSFAEAPSREVAALEDLLDIRVGTTPYALRVAEMSGLFADVKITPMPTRIPGLVGISGLRGSLLPVYDLRAMLGHTMDTNARWLAIAASVPLGLLFDRFEGHVRVRRDAIVPQGSGDVRHVREVVQLNGIVRPIVSIVSILETVTSLVQAGASEKE
ncbi:MAG: chemotaxis protein CheW, partial [Steroidobacteraceae bacterium]